VWTLKTQLALRFREKKLIIALKTILAPCCPTFLGVSDGGQVTQINPALPSAMPGQMAFLMALKLVVLSGTWW
jgi:hypothetical protein